MDLEADQVVYQRVVTYSDGQQVFIQDAPGISVAVDIDHLDIVDEQRVDDQVAPTEFVELAEKAMTHEIQIDTIGENISVIPKETPMDIPTDLQTEIIKTDEAKEV